MRWVKEVFISRYMLIATLPLRKTSHEENAAFPEEQRRLQNAVLNSWASWFEVLNFHVLKFWIFTFTSLPSCKKEDDFITFELFWGLWKYQYQSLVLGKLVQTPVSGEEKSKHGQICLFPFCVKMTVLPNTTQIVKKDTHSILFQHYILLYFI